MANIPIKISVSPPASQLAKNILFAFQREIGKKLEVAAKNVRSRIEAETGSELRNSYIYDALVNGPLDAHFGFHRGTARQRADEIVDTIVKNIQVRVNKGILGSRLGLRSGIDIFILQDGFTDLISLPGAHVITEKGDDLPWLEWLLFRGNSIIITGYEIKFVVDRVTIGDDGKIADFRSRRPNISRSGKAIMISEARKDPIRKKKDEATEAFRPGYWKVPVDYAGTENNNWLTRFLGHRDFIAKIEKIVLEEINRQFK